VRQSVFTNGCTLFVLLQEGWWQSVWCYWKSDQNL